MIKYQKPPFNLTPYQYLDIQECIPIKEHETEYRKKINRLLAALENNSKEDFDYFLDEWINAFYDESIDELLFKLLDKFTGRQWLVNILNEWLEKDNMHPVFCLQGNPGYGKSAFVAYIIKNHPDVLAYYFITFSKKSESNDHEKNMEGALHHIIFQLTTKYPAFWKYLKEHKTVQLQRIAHDLDKTNEQSHEKPSISKLFQEIIINPIAKISCEENKRIVIILDALDELKDEERSNLIDFIAESYKKFPKCFKLLITCRYNEVITRMNHCIKTIDITKDPDCAANNINDNKSYIVREFKLLNGNIDIDPGIIDVIVDKSEGSFLYLNILTKSLSGPDRPAQITKEAAMKFPQGLNGILHDFFEREYQDIKYYEDHISKILAVNFAAQNPINIQEIIELFNFTEQDAVGCEEKLGTLFICSDNEIKPFHRAVYEWVTNKDQAGKYYFDLKTGHRILAEKGEHARLKIKDKYISESLGLSGLEKKLIRELPYHYMSLGEFLKLENVLTEIGICISFFENDLSKFQFLTFFSEIEDLKRLISEYKQQLIRFEGNNERKMVARGYHVVGLIFFNLAIFIESEFFYKKAVTFYRKLGDKAKIAHIYNDLGEILHNESTVTSEKMNSLDDELKNAKDRKTKRQIFFQYYKNLFKTIGFAHKAKRYYQKSIKIRKKVLGWENPDTAESINNLGHAYLNLNKYDKSEAQYKLALEIREKILPPYHKDIAEGYFNSGMILAFKHGNDLEKYRKAIENIEKAISINEKGSKEYGHERHDLPLYHNRVGSQYKNLNEYNKAIDHYEKAVILYIRFYGVKNKKSEIAFKEYEDIYLDMKRKGIQRSSDHFDPALLTYSLEKRLRMLPENSPEIILIHNIFAIVLINNGRPADAEFYIKQSHALVDKILQDRILTDPNKNALIQYYQKYANLLINKSNYSDALVQFKKAFDICNTIEGGFLSSQTHDVYMYLVKVYLSIDLLKRREAENLINFMLDKSNELLGEYNKNSTLISRDTYHYLAIPFNEIAFHFYVPGKKWGEAAENYEKAITIIKKSEIPVEIANMELNLQVVYFRSGQQVDLEKVKQLTKIIETAGDSRAKKGYYIMKGHRSEFRKVLLQLFFAVAASDGKIEKTELDYIYKYFEISLYDELFEECQKLESRWDKQKATYQQFVDLMVSEAIETTHKTESVRNDAKEIVKQLLFISAVDEHIQKEELDTILKYIQPFGMGKDDIVKIINELHT